MRVVLAVAGLVVILGAPAARTDCAGPSSELQFAFPADGAVDVPVDAKIFVLPGAGAVRLDGVALAALDVPLWDPGPLTPGSVHVVEADIPASWRGPGTVATWTFTVGSAPAPAPTDVVVEVDGFPSQGCFIENDTACSDSFPCFMARLSTAATGVVLWFTPAENKEWMPPSCTDAPAFAFCTDGAGRFCGSVTAYGANGTTVESNEACVDADCSAGTAVNGCFIVSDEGEGEGEADGDVDDGEESKGGCASTSPPVIAAVALLGTVRRRRR